MFSQKRYQTIDLPYLHPKIDINDIQENGKLLTEEQILAVKQALASEKNDSRISKQDSRLKALNINYGIIKQEGHYFTVYKGVKHGRALGKGSFGKVKLVQELATGKFYALKIQENERASLSEHTKLFWLHKVKGSLIVRQKSNGQKKFHILMELAPGQELFEIIHNKELCLSPIRRLDICKMLIELVNHLHQQKWLHRDIKPHNAIYDLTKQILKLIDFGFAQRTIGDDFHGGLVGTPLYLATEILKNLHFKTHTYTKQTDIFALGRTIQELLGVPSFTYSHFPKGKIAYQPPITDFTTNKELADWSNTQVEDDAFKRSSLEAALEKLKDLRKNLKSTYPLKIGIVSIQQFIDANRSQQQLLIDQLKTEKMNEILLVDDNGEYKNLNMVKSKILLHLRRALEKANIILRNDILIEPFNENAFAYLIDVQNKEDIEVHATRFSYHQNHIATLPFYKTPVMAINHHAVSHTIPDMNIGENKAANAKSTPIKAAENKAVDTKTADVKGAENKAINTEATDIKVAENKASKTTVPDNKFRMDKANIKLLYERYYSLWSGGNLTTIKEFFAFRENIIFRIAYYLKTDYITAYNLIGENNLIFKKINNIKNEIVAELKKDPRYTFQDDNILDFSTHQKIFIGTLITTIDTIKRANQLSKKEPTQEEKIMQVKNALMSVTCKDKEIQNIFKTIQLVVEQARERRNPAKPTIS